MKKIIKMMLAYVIIFLIAPKITEMIFNHNDGSFDTAYIGGALTIFVFTITHKLIDKEVI